MDNRSEQALPDSSTPSRKQYSPLLFRLLYCYAFLTVAAAGTASIFLLVSDVFPTNLPHAPVSAAPLLLIGAAYLGFQGLVRPGLLDLGRALIVSSAFILWGIDQLLPAGWLATTLGDIVIVLYIVDLGWLMLDRLRPQWQGLWAKSGVGKA